MDRLWTAFFAAYPTQRAISPGSIIQVLASLGYGATGAAEQQYKQLLGITDREQFLAILSSAKMALTGYELKTSNLFIFSKDHAVVKPEYHEKVSPFVVMVGLDMDDPSTVTYVNNWVAVNTGFLNQFGSDDFKGQQLVGMNALWFSDAWDSPFKVDATKQANFTRLDGSVTEVPMMYQKSHVGYSGNNAVKLHFKGGATAEFVMDLPPNQRIPQLTYLNDEEVHLYLPRFEIDMSINLQSLMGSAGLSAINGPDYENMVVNPVILNSLKHRIYCRFDEHGAEVKALTHFGLTLAAISFKEVKVIRFDRPFHFRITKQGQSVVEGFYNADVGNSLVPFTPPTINVPSFGF